MAALTDDKKTEYREGVEISLPVDDGDVIYAGAIVCLNADGYAVPGSDTAGLKMAGIAREKADNSAGADGAVSVILRRQGIFKMTFSAAITQAAVGADACIVDDQTVALAATTTNDIVAGEIVELIDSTHAWVDIKP